MMKRNQRQSLRTFIKSTAVASVGAAVAASKVSAAGHPEVDRELYELRLYRLRRGPQPKLMDDYWRDAAVPAYKRLGIGPIGVFNITVGPDNPAMYVLIPHKSMEGFTAAQSRLDADAVYEKASREFFACAATDPAYVRMEISLLRAFKTIPRLEIPAAATGNKARIFELRTYESHNERAAAKKIEMFDTGEIAIFRRNGLQPVFFGQTLAGSKMPNLTYMLTFENMAAREKNFASFVADPEWKKLSTTPGYTDPEIVTNINNVFLKPAPYSEI